MISAALDSNGNRPLGLSESLTDVTDLLRSAVRDLQVGQMIHEPNFSLFEDLSRICSHSAIQAMSSLEMFDPKMDPRLSFYPEDREPNCEFEWPTEEAASQAMDRLLQCESFFYSGSTLLHSILLCIWLHDVNQLTLPSDNSHTVAVRAYSLAVLRCVNRIIDALYASDVIYEEDITLERFGFSLAESMPSSYILHLLDESISIFPEQSPIALRLTYRRHMLIALEYLVSSNSANFRHAFPFLSRCIESAQTLDLSDDERIDKIPYYDVSFPSNHLASCPPRPIRLTCAKQSLLQQKQLFEQLLYFSNFPAVPTADSLMQFSYSIATCLPANTIPRACVYLLGLSVSNLDPPHRLFLRCLSMNRSRAHRFMPKLFAMCPSLTISDFTTILLIHHVEIMLELDLLASYEYHSAFYALDLLYSSLMPDSLTPFMRGCMLLAKALFFSFVAFSHQSHQERSTVLDYESIFNCRFSLLCEHSKNRPTYAEFQKFSALHSKKLGSTVQLAVKHFESAKSCFSEGPFSAPCQKERAKKLATIAGCNCVSVKTVTDRQKRSLSVRFIGDHTYPIIRWASS